MSLRSMQVEKSRREEFPPFRVFGAVVRRRCPGVAGPIRTLPSWLPDLDLTALNTQPALREELDSLRINPVLFDQDARR